MVHNDMEIHVRVHKQRIECRRESESCCCVAHFELFVLPVITVDAMQGAKRVACGTRERNDGNVVLLVRSQQARRKNVHLAVLVDQCFELWNLQP